MRIGVFGGTFDPPHNGHLLAASDAYEALELDRLFFVPNATQPLKTEGAGAAAPERLEMVRRLCQADRRFDVDPVEVERGGLSFTVDTLKGFRTRFPGAALFLLVGEDVVPTLPAWGESKTVLELAELVVLARGDGATTGREAGRRLATRRVDISSTEIRARVARGLPLTGFVPPGVAEYIETHGLYGARVK